MAEKITKLKMFVSNPSDIDHIRGLIDKDINNINNDLENFTGVTIRIIDWRRDVVPGIAKYPQQVINRHLDDSDIYVGLLGTRFGTPTPRYGSGTEEEFNIAYNRFRHDPTCIRILFYFYEPQNSNEKDIDPDQLKRVNDFKKHLGTEKGLLYQVSSSPEDFLDRFRNHIKKLVKEEWSDNSWKPVPDLEPTPKNEVKNLIDVEPSVEKFEEEELGIIDLRIQLNEAIELSMEFVEKINELMEKSTKEDIRWTEKVKKELAARVKPTKKRAEKLIEAKTSDFSRRAKKLRSLTVNFNAASEDLFDLIGRMLYFQLRSGISTSKEIKDAILNISNIDIIVKKARDIYKEVVNSISNLPEPTLDFKRQKRKLMSQFEQLRAVLGLWLDRSAAIRKRFGVEDDEAL